LPDGVPEGVDHSNETPPDPAVLRATREVRFLGENGARIYRDGGFSTAAFNAQAHSAAELRAALAELVDRWAALPDDGSPGQTAERRANLDEISYLTGRLHQLSAWMRAYRGLIGEAR
jgi:hypothetical protein